MMIVKEFAEEVLNEVRGKAGDRFQAELTKTLKNNGGTRTAIRAMAPEQQAGPSIDLEAFYAEYQNGGRGIDELAGEVYQKLMEHMEDLKAVRLDGLRNWEVMKPHIHATLINFERNQEFLKGKPYRKFLDLAVVYHVQIEGLKDGEIGTFLVNDSCMEVWQQTEESLYQTAASNMRLAGEPVFESLEELLRQMRLEFQLPVPASTPVAPYVLTNQEKRFGAAELLDNGTLKWIREKLGDDFIVLPSSVHECIIIPSDETASYQELAEMVTEINGNAVLMEERLSDHVYLYERKEERLKIAA